MKNRGLTMLGSLGLLIALVVPSAAGVKPFVRVDYGGKQYRMPAGNRIIEANETAWKQAGYPADFKTIGSGYGPGVSAGLWIVPNFRLGGNVTYGRSLRENHIDDASLTFAHDIDLRTTDASAEAAYRFDRLGGFMIGGSVGRSRTVLIEELLYVDASTSHRENVTAITSKMTYEAFVGFDQTNAAGVAGFVQFGYRYRDVGAIPTLLEIHDGSSTSVVDATTAPLDYSGFYLKMGIGYDGH